MEADTALLDLLLTVPAEASMTFLSRRWRAAAQDFYTALTLALSEDFDSAAEETSLPATTTLQQLAKSKLCQRFTVGFAKEFASDS